MTKQQKTMSWTRARISVLIDIREKLDLQLERIAEWDIDDDEWLEFARKAIEDAQIKLHKLEHNDREVLARISTGEKKKPAAPLSPAATKTQNGR